MGNNNTVITNQTRCGAVITAQGAAIIADCILTGKKLPIVEAAAGDGGGSPVVPSPNQTALVNERWRGSIVRAEPSTVTANMIDVKIVIGEEVGGFVIREMGLFSEEGVLIAVCNTPDTEKVPISEGVSGKLTVNMHIVVADVSVLEFTITPDLDMVSRPEMESAIAKAVGEIEPLSGTGEPNASTQGQVGQKYEDTTSGDIYTCTAITPGESGASPHYLWVPGKLGTLAEIRTAYSNIDRRLVGINLLHNAYWAAKEYIINQRGQLEYTGGYGIDRWRIDNQGGSAKLSILDNCIRFQKLTTQSAMAIHQSLEFPQFLRGKVITASVLRRGTGNTSMLIYTDKGNLGAPSFKPSEKWVLDSYTFTVPTDINRVSLFLYPSTGNNAYYTDYMASQLELGPVSTLAHKEGDTWVLNDPPPNLALERLKCQRYQVFGQLESTYLTGTSNTKIAFLPTPTALRATPTIVGTPEVWTVDDNIKLSNVTVSVHSVVKNGVLLSLVGDTRACYVSMKSGCGFDSNL